MKTDGTAGTPGLPPEHLVEIAIEASTYSPCQSKRGVVIFRGDSLVMHGCNYKPRGFDCDGSAACKATCRVEAIHAEQQALLLAGTQAAGAEMLHVKTVNGQLVPSGEPSCWQCSKLALAAGITGMWLYHADGWKRYDTAEWYRRALLRGPDEGLRAEQEITKLPDGGSLNGPSRLGASQNTDTGGEIRQPEARVPAGGPVETPRQRARRTGIDYDNHHNALLCPYCNPDGLKFAEPVTEGGPLPPAASPWQPIESAPKDGSLFLTWAPEREGLPPMYSLCAWHSDAGFCIDELRVATHWMPLPDPPPRATGGA